MTKKSYCSPRPWRWRCLLGRRRRRRARAYIGTYTPSRRARRRITGEGIYLVDIDDATGAASNPRLVAKMPVAVLDHLVGRSQVSLCQ